MLIWFTINPKWTTLGRNPGFGREWTVTDCLIRKGPIFVFYILCLRFRASLICINNCPMRSNTKQSIYYSASSFHMFRVSTTPIISSTQTCNYSLRYCAATSLKRGQAWPRWSEVAAQKIWPVPEAVVTVLCTPDDGCGWHPKHIEWTCRIINRLLCVASRWTIINIVFLNFTWTLLKFLHSLVLSIPVFRIVCHWLRVTFSWTQ